MFRVVIPAHNRVEKTIGVLECLLAQTHREVSVVLIDDGSVDGTADEVRRRIGSKLDCTIIRGDGTLWWGGAMRLGIEETLRVASDDDVLVMMNDDIVFDDRFFERALTVIDRHPDTVIGSLIVDDSDEQTVVRSGTRMRCWPLAISVRPFEGSLLSELPHDGKAKEVDFLGAKATFLPIRIVRVIGNINARALPHYHGDGEFVYRAKRAGYPVVVSPDLVVFHSQQTTGLCARYSPDVRVRDMIRSLWDIRSPNNLKHRFTFAWLSCPPVWVIPYAASSVVKLFVRYAGWLTLGRHTKAVRRWLNTTLSGEP